MKNITFAIWCICLMIALSCTKEQPEPTVNSVESYLPFAPNYVLNSENVYRDIMNNGILFSDVVLRQSILETGYYSSHNCLERNNLFGMCGGEKTKDNIHGYAIYPTWMESVKAYKVWQSKRIDDSVTDYYTFLKDWNYAESEEYERKLKSINLVIVKK